MWTILEWVIQLLAMWFFGSLAVVVCGLVVMFATMPNDMDDYKQLDLPTPEGKMWHIVSFLMGIWLFWVFPNFFQINL
jgi:hypothetical protein